MKMIVIFVLRITEDFMAVYNTVQRAVLLDFLRAHGGESLTVRDITAMLAEERGENVPSESTVYRIMRDLVKCGVVRKDVNVESRENVYSLAEDDRHGVSMRCRVCGSVYSVDGENGKRIKEDLTRCGAGVPDGDIEVLIKCGKCGTADK